jgi:prepilin-type N-terminal cleavage/methylation domain-containing protein
MHINKKAFTLIELLVVVLIIAILAAIALPRYQRAVLKARAAQSLILLRSVLDAEQRYYLINGKYTIRFSDFDITFPGSLSGSASWHDSWNVNERINIQIRNDGGPEWGTVDAGANTLAMRVVFNNGKIYCTAYSSDPAGLDVCSTYAPKAASGTATFCNSSNTCYGPIN